ncbi:MAG: SpoIIE family protein phosphatase [bacterium]|nr:SpoIIE family protein phosphatase [bacterium]
MLPLRQQTHALSGLTRRLLSRQAHLALGALTLAAVLFSGYDATRTRPSDGTVWLLGRPQLAVLDVVPRPQGPATPLRAGDIIVGLGSSIVDSPQSAANELRRHSPGERIDYLIKRDGRQLTVTVPLTSTRVDLQDYAVNVILAVIYLVIGFAVYLRSQDDRPAALFFVLCLLFGLYFMTNLQAASYFLGAIIAQNMGAFARFMLPAVFLNFFLVFPTKKLVLLRHPFLVPLLYLVPWALYLRFTLDQFLGDQGARIHAASWIVLGVFYMCGLAALLHAYFSYRDPLMRRRVRILTVGTLAAVVPFLVFKIGLEELSFRTGLTRLGALPLAAIPISFGYCVARYQVLQIDVLLKRNLSYGLLTFAIWGSFLGGAWWLGSRALTLLPGAGPLAAAGIALAVAAGLWPVRRQAQRALDVRFYHSRDNLAALIEEFSKEVPRLFHREIMLRWVGSRLQTVLDLPSLAVYVVTPGGDGTAYARVSLTRPRSPYAESSDPEPSDTGLPRARYPEHISLPGLARHLARHGEPLWTEAPDADQALGRQAITREQVELLARLQEHRVLAEAGVELLIPMVLQGRLMGLFALPRRPGDGEYQMHELRLLTIVAGQVALQIENTRLYAEEAAKLRLEEEVAMARQIQSRLLPRRLPSPAGLEIDAVNISSKQVSGDYYDVIERQDGRLAVVIADVSGKGVPASILASNLQAALRAQCDMCDSPGLLLERINRQIHASTDPQHFATLFLAMYDPISRQLVYSSGGHNPPLLVRADGRRELLCEGGLPLGAFDFGTYDEGRLTLEPGDLLFMYTDGLTETKDPDGDEDFGETRLGDLLHSERDQVLADIFAAITRDLLRFRGREDADDDITMIGLKVTTVERMAMVGGQSA